MNTLHIKAFTLVELIVVITILAILGTISFLSFQSYNKSARNSVRLDAISKIATIIENQKNLWMNALAFTFTGSEVPLASIAGTGAIVELDYKAGEYNAQTLGLQEAQYLDPLSGKKYLMWVTTKKGTKFQLATFLEEGSQIQTKVIGTYTPRQSLPILGTGEIDKNTFTLSGYENIGLFSQYDYLTGATLPANSFITDISNDGLVLTLSQAFTGPATEIALWQDEVEGLIYGDGAPLQEAIYTGSSTSTSASSSTSGSGGPTTCVFGSGLYGTCTFGS